MSSDGGGVGARFHDCQDASNPANGKLVRSADDVADLARSSSGRPPYCVELEHTSGSVLLVGLGRDVGAVEHMSAVGLPFVALAPDPAPDAPDVEFLCGGTGTPFHGRWVLPMALVERIATHFVETGARAPWIEWEAI